MMADQSAGETHITISGGTQQGPVLMGRDFRDVHIENIVQAAAAPVALAQLPALATGFTGRDSELAMITSLLDPKAGLGAVVVSAVAGLAGVGKTTLAVAAGHAVRARGWFNGGVLFINLHGYDEFPVGPGQALDALLRALGVSAEHLPHEIEARSALYRSVLADIRKPVLIVADNASSEAQVRPLLPGAGSHRVVVTSRHTLAGLDARLLDLTVLDDIAAVGLLDTALRAARPDDNRITSNREAAMGLAGICGGLPLALQIAAALLKADPVCTVSEMAADLEAGQERLERLRYDDGSGANVPSVTAAFELSYRKLDEITARVFRLLPVNPGPDFSTAAAAALADMPTSSLRTVVGDLVRAHLIEAAPGATGRWRMHDLLRLYAQQLSDAHADADGREQARDRLFGYYLETAGAADDHLRALRGMVVPSTFADRESALRWLDEERPNLVAAIATAAETGPDQFALRLPVLLTTYFTWRRRFDDWLTTIPISLKTARDLGDKDGEAAALNKFGLVLQNMRRFEEAITAHQDAAAVYRKTGDRQGEGRALNNLGITLIQMRRCEEAITPLEGDLAICRESGDRQGEGITLDNLGYGLRELERFAEAITAHQDAVAIFRETGDRHAEGRALDNLGAALRGARRFEEAITAHQHAAAIYRETGDRHGEAESLDDVGVALRGLGRLEDAIVAHQDAAAICRETGDRHGEGEALDNLGNALRDLGRLKDAIAAHQDAAAIFHETGDRHGEDTARHNLETDQVAQQV